MTRMRNLAVRAGRREPPDSLDFFPTPPWATRSVMTDLTRRGLYVRGESVFDPCCGQGHMTEPLREFTQHVHASDIFPYGYGEVSDFLDDGETPAVDWIVMNPPFNAAVEFVRRALEHPAAKAAIGVVALVRLAWIEGGERSGRAALFDQHPPALVLVPRDRVAMTKGRWEPDATTMTAYAWIVWIQRGHLRWPGGEPRLGWLGPGEKTRHTHPDDARRFGVTAPAPLFDGGAA